VPAFPAYEALLQGRHHFFQQTSDSLVQAMACYERAAALDPDYPNPHDELGACHMLLWYWGIKPGREMVPIVRREVARTEALGHLSPWGQAMRGVVEAAYEYDREAARRLLTAGLTDREGYRAESRWCYATFHLVPAGRFDEAIDTLETSLVEDPLNVVWRAAIAHFQNLAGRHERAREQLDAVHRITRGYWVSHLYLAEVWVAAGRWAEALAEAEEAHRLAPWNARVLGMLAAIAGRLGDTARAEAVTARLAQGPPHWGAEGMVLHALVTGDTGAAADWYARAVAHRNVWVLVESRGWNTRALRASASWAALAASMRI
jgi:tetratricopeptide (TPR) repeat protein